MICRYYLCPVQGAALCSLVRMARARVQPGLRILRFRLVCRKVSCRTRSRSRSRYRMLQFVAASPETSRLHNSIPWLGFQRRDQLSRNLRWCRRQSSQLQDSLCLQLIVNARSQLTKSRG